jgi:hypothetical protein
MSETPPAAAPVYRQDEFTREPTEWTRPLQMAVAFYFFLTAASGLGVLAQSARLRQFTLKQVTEQTHNTAGVTPQMVQQQVDALIGVITIFAVVFAVAYVSVAILNVVGRWTWLYIVDMVLLAMGSLGALGGVSGLSDSSKTPYPVAQTVLQLALALAALGLLLWMLAALVRYGVWACRKVPVLLTN